MKDSCSGPWGLDKSIWHFIGLCRSKKLPEWGHVRGNLQTALLSQGGPLGLSEDVVKWLRNH